MHNYLYMHHISIYGMKNCAVIKAKLVYISYTTVEDAHSHKHPWTWFMMQCEVQTKSKKQQRIMFFVVVVVYFNFLVGRCIVAAVSAPVNTIFYTRACISTVSLQCSFHFAVAWLPSCLPACSQCKNVFSFVCQLCVCCRHFHCVFIHHLFGCNIRVPLPALAYNKRWPIFCVCFSLCFFSQTKSIPMENFECEYALDGERGASVHACG